MGSSRSTYSRHYEWLDDSPLEVVRHAKKLCNEIYDDSELIFPIGRVLGSYGSTRFRVERVSDRRMQWYLSDGVKFYGVPQKAVLLALEAELREKSGDRGVGNA